MDWRATRQESSGNQARPHTSWEWWSILPTMWCCTRTSWLMTALSLEPEVSRGAFQARARHSTGVAAQTANLSLRRNVPQLYARLGGAHGKVVAAVWGPSHRARVIVGTLVQRLQLLGGGGDGVPQVDTLGKSNGQVVVTAPEE
jgi:hypothetical protein